MISNPCTWFGGKGGSYHDREKFEYEGGSKLYHFSPDINLHIVFDHWRPINLIFFANDEKHAADIIERMLKFRMECMKAYEEDRGTDYSRGELTRQLPQLLLDNKDKWVFELAPVNQFYNVGWACNDTIL